MVENEEETIDDAAAKTSAEGDSAYFQSIQTQLAKASVDSFAAVAVADAVVVAVAAAAAAGTVVASD